MAIDIGSAAAVLGTLKTAQEMAAALIGLRDEAKIQAKIIELNQVILDAQRGALSAQANEATLQEEIRALNAQIDGFDDWTARAKQYVLTKLHPGSVAYVRKDVVYKLDADHYLCPTCFEGRKAVPLQGSTTGWGRRTLKCPSCDTVVIHSDGGQPEVNRSSTPRRRF